MKRIEHLQVRIEPELKARIKGRDMSAYVRGLIERDLGLSDGSAGWYDSQAQAERVAGSTGGSVPALTQLTKQLEAQGKAPGEAKSLAERRLGL